MLKRLNEKVKNLDVLDIGLTKLTLLVTGIAASKLFPQLLTIRYSVLLVAIIVLAARPTYKYFLGK